MSHLVSAQICRVNVPWLRCSLSSRLAIWVFFHAIFKAALKLFHRSRVPSCTLMVSITSNSVSQSDLQDRDRLLIIECCFAISGGISGSTWDGNTSSILKSRSCPYTVSNARASEVHPLDERYISFVVDIRPRVKVTNWTTLPARLIADNGSMQRSK